MHTQITPLASWSDDKIYEWFGVNLRMMLNVEKICQQMTVHEMIAFDNRMNKDKKGMIKQMKLMK